MMEKYELFRKTCEHINATEKSPRSLMAYWALRFMEEFDRGEHVVFPEKENISSKKGTAHG